MSPAVLVLDEPFSSLDLPTRLALTDVLRNLPQRIVLASHDLDLLAQMDRVLWFERGGLRADGRPFDILAAYRAQAMAAARPAAVAP
jgi:biotin transport system ATP-binding protein